jgi:hypothetical protein
VSNPFETTMWFTDAFKSMTEGPRLADAGAADRMARLTER